MTGDGGGLNHVASSINEPGRRRLAQAMKRAMPESTLVAAVAKPVSKTRGRERRTKFGDQKRQVPAWRGVNDPAQLWMHWDGQFQAGRALGLSSDPVENFDFPVLLLVVFEADVLLAHRDDILPRLPGVEPERQRQARLSADGMAFLEHLDFGIGPAMKAALLLRLELLHALGRVVVAPIKFLRDFHHLAQHL